MPLDSHTYLRNHGWQGTGKALREGAIARPIALAQKKTLAGLGKDRDEAFPFWDHLFTAAASAIKLKLDSDDERDSDLESTSNSRPELSRTSTGIISNKRPTDGVSALPSGSSTPSTSDGPPLSLIATAKREAAKRNLYSRFFRGPLIGPDSELDLLQSSSSTTPPSSLTAVSSPVASRSITPELNKTSTLNKHQSTAEDEKSRKAHKRARKAEKEAARAEKAARKEERRRRRAARAGQEAAELTAENTAPSEVKIVPIMVDEEQGPRKSKKVKLAEGQGVVNAIEAQAVMKVKKKRKRTD